MIVTGGNTDRRIGRRTATAIVLGLAALATAGCAGSTARQDNSLPQSVNQAADRDAGMVALADAAAARGDYAAAIPLYRTAHLRGYISSRPLIGLGRSLAAIGQYPMARDAYRAALTRSDAPEALRGIGNAELMLGDYGHAIEHLSRAVRADSANPANYASLGLAFDVSGQHDAALEVYREGIDRSGGDHVLRSNYGLSLALAGALDQGIDVLIEAVRDHNSTARDRQNLALAFALDRQYDRAAAMAAIDLDTKGVENGLVYAASLSGLEAEDRLRALLAGAAAPRTDIAHKANPGAGNQDIAQIHATIARLLPRHAAGQPATPAQASQATAEPAALPATDPAVLAGAPPLLGAEGWAVQIAAYRKLEHLSPGWAYLSQKYADLIAGLEPRRSEVELPPSDNGPSGFYYRLNAGPLATKEQADGICQAIEKEGGECWVRAPEPAEGALPADGAAERELVGSADHEAVMRMVADRLLDGAVATPVAQQQAVVPVYADFAVAALAARDPFDVPLAADDFALAVAAARDPLGVPLQTGDFALAAPQTRAPLVAPLSFGDFALAAPLAQPPLLAPIFYDDLALAASTPRLALARPQPELLPSVAALLKLPDSDARLDEAAPALGSDAVGAEVRPASFGATGATRLGQDQPKSQTISAFEEAEQRLAKQP